MGGGEDSLLLEFTSTFAAAAAAAAGGDECSLTDTCGFNKDITWAFTGRDAAPRAQRAQSQQAVAPTHRQRE